MTRLMKRSLDSNTSSKVADGDAAPPEKLRLLCDERLVHVLSASRDVLS